MATLKFCNLFLEDAKAILNISYEGDKSATYVNDFTVSGSHLTASIKKNEAASKNSRLPKFDADVSSDYWSEPTMREKFEDYLFAL